MFLVLLNEKYASNDDLHALYEKEVVYNLIIKIENFVFRNRSVFGFCDDSSTTTYFERSTIIFKKSVDRLNFVESFRLYSSLVYMYIFDFFGIQNL